MPSGLQALVPKKNRGFPTKAQDRNPPPALGEHTGEVLAEMGLDAAQMERLQAGKVV